MDEKTKDLVNACLSFINSMHPSKLKGESISKETVESHRLRVVKSVIDLCSINLERDAITGDLVLDAMDVPSNPIIEHTPNPATLRDGAFNRDGSPALLGNFKYVDAMKQAKKLEALRASIAAESAKYKSREFCHAVNCSIQKLIDSNDGSFTKDWCKANCVKTAWEFHDWLQKNGYEIVKKTVEEKDEKKEIKPSNPSPFELSNMPMGY